MTQEDEIELLNERLTNARNAVIAAEKAGDPVEKVLPLREAAHRAWTSLEKLLNNLKPEKN